MQKIFRKYAVIIITAAIVAILIVNYAMVSIGARKQQVTTFQSKIDQIIHTIQSNQVELQSIRENLDEDYLTRARAAAYVIDLQPEMLDDVEELQNLVSLLNVDEIHVIDENGIIISSSVTKYLGLDFHDGEQTVEFLKLLEDEEGTAYLIQKEQPNTAEQKMMKYVGVTRKGIHGIVQVGLTPVRLEEAQARNTYRYIFNRFPTAKGEEYFAIDSSTGKVTACTGSLSAGDLESKYENGFLADSEQGIFLGDANGESKFVVTKQYGNMLIGAAISKENMIQSVWGDMRTTLICLVFVEIIVIVFLNVLVEKKVVNGIQEILSNLTQITNGNYDIQVKVGGNPELEELSAGIDAMVRSVLNSSDRISKIIEMSAIPLAAFEYKEGNQYVFFTPGLRDMLGFSTEEMEKLHQDPKRFFQKIQDIMKMPVEDEKDVFPVQDKFVSIHLSMEGKDYLGVVTDTTSQVLENRRIRYENNHDHLTGLYKYSYFMQKAAKHLKNNLRGRICSCIMLDMDNFKSINDTYGHEMGDYYLKSFADILMELPKEHCFPARRSGDEFCIFTYGQRDKSEILKLLDSLWTILEQRPVQLSDKERRVIRISCGYAWTGNEEMDLKLLMRQADVALYRAKETGKGCFVEYNSMEAKEPITE